MPILIIQLAILIAVVFVIGCILGRILKGRKAADKSREDTMIAAALSVPAVSEKPETIAAIKPVIIDEVVQVKIEDVQEEKEDTLQSGEVAEPDVIPGPVDEIEAEDPVIDVEDVYRPQLLEAPLNGNPDDLTAISGIGKSLETILHKIGVFHYAQIAQWNLDHSAWVERQIGFAGRVTRESWVDQATKLIELAEQSSKQKRSKPKKAGVKSKVQSGTGKVPAKRRVKKQA